MLPPHATPLSAPSKYVPTLLREKIEMTDEQNERDKKRETEMHV